VIRVSILHDLVFIVEISHEHARPRAKKLFKRLPSTLDSFVRDLQQFPLTGVQGHRLRSCDAEKAVIKVSRIILEQMAPSGVHASRSLAIGMVEAVDVDAVLGELTPTVSFVF
jgi:hypothetical protein